MDSGNYERLTERVTVFVATMPEGLTTYEQRRWLREVNEGVAAVVADANRSIFIGRSVVMTDDVNKGVGWGCTNED